MGIPVLSTKLAYWKSLNVTENLISFVPCDANIIFRTLTTDSKSVITLAVDKVDGCDLSNSSSY